MDVYHHSEMILDRAVHALARPQRSSNSTEGDAIRALSAEKGGRVQSDYPQQGSGNAISEIFQNG